MKKLPIIKMKGIDYYKDVRLREFRQVSNPHVRIPFEESTFCKVCQKDRPVSNDKVCVECQINRMPAAIKASKERS